MVLVARPTFLEESSSCTGILVIATFHSDRSWQQQSRINRKNGENKKHKQYKLFSD